MNRTADTHTLEKLDCAVLPVNRPNKAPQDAEETGKGRAQTKENTVLSHELPTQSGKGLPQGLHGVHCRRHK